MTPRSCWPASTSPTTDQRPRGRRRAVVDPSNLLAVIDANEAAIEKAGVVLHSYTAPGTGHGIFEWPKFYEMEVNGEKLVDWVTRLIEGNRSRTCTARSAASVERPRHRWLLSASHSLQTQNGHIGNDTRDRRPCVVETAAVSIGSIPATPYISTS